MARKVRVEFAIEPDTLDKAEDAAENRDISRSQFIREAVRQEVQAFEGEDGGAA